MICLVVSGSYPMIRTYYSVAYSCSNGIPMAIEILLLVYTLTTLYLRGFLPPKHYIYTVFTTSQCNLFCHKHTILKKKKTGRQEKSQKLIDQYRTVFKSFLDSRKKKKIVELGNFLGYADKRESFPTQQVLVWHNMNI